MEYPLNYKFGENWQSTIVPHLDNPRVLRSLQRGIDDYMKNFPTCGKRYKKDTCPANYSSLDKYYMLMDRKCRIYIKELKKNGKLPQEYIDLKNKIKEYNSEDSEEYDVDDYCFQLLCLENKITKHLYKWNNIKYDLGSYVLWGSSHSYAPTFELTLANLVLPDEKWRVRRGNRHTTVIDEKGNKVFDLIYWALDGRLENHVFGDPVRKEDPTLGGRIAYEYSEREK